MKTTKLQEQIRAFHVTGAGLETYVPDGPLRPAALADMEPAMLHLHDGLPAFRDVYAKALREQRGKSRQRLIENARYCRDRVQEILDLDDSRDPRVGQSERAVTASLGQGGSFLNSGALAALLQTATASSTAVPRMESARRKRCETALAALNEFLREAANQPLFWEFPAADAGAIAFCERQLDMLASTLRALRVARLEIDSAYDPAVHDEALARFTWESADAEELMAMPAVLIVDTAARVAEASLTLFGRLLRSGLPMQFVVPCPPFYTGDLAFLSVAYREAFVMQSSTACPQHLEEGFLDMAHTLHPAVCVLSTADPALFHQSGVFPLFVYDPEQGEDWVQRFRTKDASLSGINAAHVAAISPVEAPRHFRVIPKDCWSPEQVELTDYIGQFKKQPPLSIPFLWVLDAKGEQQRAVLTRELALIARDRIKAGRLLAEWAEAGKPAPPVVDTEQVRQDAAKEASRDTILKVVHMLTGGVVAVQPSSTAPAPAPVAEVHAPAATTSEVVADPYIESSLCTSCNDCMKINSRMFLYNAEKQAYISDPTTGTFAELVKAAEGCPARCIHPGAPRPGDRSATPQLIARAAKFNS
jgi:ferredoxin